MPPTRAARWMTASGRAWSNTARTASGRVRSNSRLRGTVIRAHPAASSRATTARPMNPAPPVTSTDLCVQNPMRETSHSVAADGESSAGALPERTALRYTTPTMAFPASTRGTPQVPPPRGRRDLVEFYDRLALEREAWKARNAYYYRERARYYAFYIPPGQAVLEIGNGTGDVLKAVAARRGVGCEVSPAMAALTARSES